MFGAVLVAIALLTPGALVVLASPTSDYLLMPRSELLNLPTSGRAWDYVRARALETWPAPNLQDQDVKHGNLVLAAALVHARTGDTAMAAKARAGIKAAMTTWRPITTNGVLSIGRQLGAYVLAADLIKLDGTDDTAFRAFLRDVLGQQLGTHGRWTYLKAAHEDAPNNWGAFAGASRIAASLYLGDSTDVARAERVLRGFLGDRSAWSSFQGQINDMKVDAATWACNSTRLATVPVNPPCTLSGINVDGAAPADISRDGSLAWPPSPVGISYTIETLQGIVLQAELLARNGYPGVWTASSSAIRRIADLVQRSHQSGGPGWNESSVKRHVPWLLNFRYGTSYPTVDAWYGRVFGYTDWLYGGRRATTTSAPSAVVSSSPTAAASPTAAPVSSPPSTSPSAAPTIAATPKATLTATPTVTQAPTPTPTTQATSAPTPTVTATVTQPPTPTPTAHVTASPTTSSPPSPSPTSASPTATPTETATPARNPKAKGPKEKRSPKRP